ncbi:GFA family protein [Corallincola holothuriorum]|uniref:GFA family protein n=1 Tax=Corallincola holothuriorum TaxID=2282215 RepID=A0A368NL90_9GAMM|nr:GFA family protein [Corallincola holothuriorum]RCU50091.1 GFA family protein [Corallincola holothuriorum]
MTDKTQLQGGCLCGAIRYQTSAMPFAADHCHCRQCQKHTGAVVASWMDFKTEQVSWTKGTVNEYPSSEYVRRGFCPDCGSTLTYRDTRHPDYTTMTIATLDKPSQVQPTYHIHTDSQVSWLVIDDDCKRFPQGCTEESNS